uniref:Uncharacterized protein n=1 Tax=Chromera velia CCMP2878 TaxID=1169474 RepID=A0A0G4I729_9ALVE|eukprot:Cvel_11580.t1-p1 / transcript=Cvel_11580.t1 / gene=Cvel_11580 / organism=Chromera_velia_CCMP2878 / gene_product=NFX1-type zinc finger-containing protein 1, putative / transcript_product=NFX1-type zinc finger-containing protein 1, putative / location=Cvel_scaffold732:28006-37621(-) / protein_length=2527 / sequence_SO=supercontig / SO=protein_coding / is_pseudo=false
MPLQVTTGRKVPREEIRAVVLAALNRSEIDLVQSLEEGQREELASRITELRPVLSLYGTQLEAFAAGLFSSLHCTQGPPGTGKTYVGVCLVLALHTIRAAVQEWSGWRGRGVGLVVVLSYKNHALDEFLLDLLEASGGGGKHSQSLGYRGALIRCGKPEASMLERFGEGGVATQGEERAKKALGEAVLVLRESKKQAVGWHRTARTLEAELDSLLGSLVGMQTEEGNAVCPETLCRMLESSRLLFRRQDDMAGEENPSGGGIQKGDSAQHQLGGMASLLGEGWRVLLFCGHLQALLQRAAVFSERIVEGEGESLKKALPDCAFELLKSLGGDLSTLNNFRSELPELLKTLFEGQDHWKSSFFAPEQRPLFLFCMWVLGLQPPPKCEVEGCPMASEESRPYCTELHRCMAQGEQPDFSCKEVRVQAQVMTERGPAPLLFCRAHMCHEMVSGFRPNSNIPLATPCPDQALSCGGFCPGHACTVCAELSVEGKTASPAERGPICHLHRCASEGCNRLRALPLRFCERHSCVTCVEEWREGRRDSVETLDWNASRFCQRDRCCGRECPYGRRPGSMFCNEHLCRLCPENGRRQVDTRAHGSGLCEGHRCAFHLALCSSPRLQIALHQDAGLAVFSDFCAEHSCRVCIEEVALGRAERAEWVQELWPRNTCPHHPSCQDVNPDGSDCWELAVSQANFVQCTHHFEQAWQRSRGPALLPLPSHVPSKKRGNRNVTVPTSGKKKKNGKREKEKENRPKKPGTTPALQLDSTGQCCGIAKKSGKRCKSRRQDTASEPFFCVDHFDQKPDSDSESEEGDESQGASGEESETDSIPEELQPVPLQQAMQYSSTAASSSSSAPPPHSLPRFPQHPRPRVTPCPHLPDLPRPSLLKSGQCQWHLRKPGQKAGEARCPLRVLLPSDGDSVSNFGGNLCCPMHTERLQEEVREHAAAAMSASAGAEAGSGRGSLKQNCPQVLNAEAQHKHVPWSSPEASSKERQLAEGTRQEERRKEESARTGKENRGEKKGNNNTFEKSAPSEDAVENDAADHEGVEIADAVREDVHPDELSEDEVGWESDEEGGGVNEDLRRVREIADCDVGMGSDGGASEASDDSEEMQGEGGEGGKASDDKKKGHEEEDGDERLAFCIVQSWSWATDRRSRVESIFRLLRCLHSLVNELRVRCEPLIREKREEVSRAGAAAFKNACVVGATVVGAARRLEALRAAQPFAVVVEEACEVMEETLVSVLACKSVRKVGMIGDHRQLPAFVQNHWFNLEIACPSLKVSLFERLISGSALPEGARRGGNRMAPGVFQKQPFTILDEQRRMLTMIADITRQDYSDLVEIKDHPHTAEQHVGDALKRSKDFPDKHREQLRSLSRPWREKGECVPGMAEKIFFWNIENNQESRAVAGLSACNEREAESVAGLVEYLLLCGVSPGSISVITPYKGQKTLITKHLRDRKCLTFYRREDGPPPRSATVTVSTVDRYQGDENDVIILSLVRVRPGNRFVALPNRFIVACSRARIGFFIVGCLDAVTKSGRGGRERDGGGQADGPSHWRRFVESLQKGEGKSRERDGVGAQFPICCPLHGTEGGEESAGRGRREVKVAGEFPSKQTWTEFCTAPCEERLPACRHPCGLPCHWPTATLHNSECRVPVERPCSLHKEIELLCKDVCKPPHGSLERALEFFQCEVPDEYERPQCQHRLSLPCWEVREFENGVSEAPPCQVVVGDFVHPVCNHVFKKPKCHLRQKYEQQAPTCNTQVLHTRECGHEQRMPCHRHQKELDAPALCKEDVETKRPRCGHKLSLRCGNARQLLEWWSSHGHGSRCADGHAEAAVKCTEEYGPDESTDPDLKVPFLLGKPCGVPMSLELPCGHVTKSRCQETFQIAKGLREAPLCEEKVSFVSVCGHEAKGPCWVRDAIWDCSRFLDPYFEDGGSAAAAIVTDRRELPESALESAGNVLPEAIGKSPLSIEPHARGGLLCHQLTQLNLQKPACESQVNAKRFRCGHSVSVPCRLSAEVEKPQRGTTLEQSQRQADGVEGPRGNREVVDHGKAYCAPPAVPLLPPCKEQVDFLRPCSHLRKGLACDDAFLWVEYPNKRDECRDIVETRHPVCGHSIRVQCRLEGVLERWRPWGEREDQGVGEERGPPASLGVLEQVAGRITDPLTAEMGVGFVVNASKVTPEVTAFPPELRASDRDLLKCSQKVTLVRECGHEDTDVDCATAFGFIDCGPCRHEEGVECKECGGVSTFQCHELRRAGHQPRCRLKVKRECTLCRLNKVEVVCHETRAVCSSEVTWVRDCGHQLSWVCGREPDPRAATDMMADSQGPVLPCRECLIPLWKNALKMAEESIDKQEQLPSAREAEGTLGKDEWEFLQMAAVHAKEELSTIGHVESVEVFDFKHFRSSVQTKKQFFVGRLRAHLDALSEASIVREDPSRLVLPPPSLSDPSCLRTSFDLVFEKAQKNTGAAGPSSSSAAGLSASQHFKKQATQWGQATLLSLLSTASVQAEGDGVNAQGELMIVVGAALRHRVKDDLHLRSC